MKNKSLGFYLGLKYPIRFIPNEDGSFYADIPDLPGCMTEGNNLDDAFHMIEDAKREWLEATLDSGMKIPLPSTEREYSGKLVVRIPKTLHSSLSETAEKEGVSLNQYINHVLSSFEGGISVGRLISERLEKAHFRYLDTFIGAINKSTEALHDQLEPNTVEMSESITVSEGGRKGIAV